MRKQINLLNRKQIQKTYNTGETTQREIADDYGIDISTVGRIVREDLTEPDLTGYAHHPVRKNIWVNIDGTSVYNAYSGRYLKPTANNLGYMLVFVHQDGERFHMMVASLVYEAWTGEVIADGYETDHIDFQRDNNHLSNLQVLTISENRSRRRCNKLDRTSVRALRRLWDTGQYTRRALADRFEIAYSTCWQVVAGRTWQEPEVA